MSQGKVQISFVHLNKDVWLQNHVTMFLYMSSIAPVRLQEFRYIGSFTGISLHTVGSFTGISLHWFIYRNKLSLCTIISRIP